VNRLEKAARIQEILDRLIPDPAVPLDHRDPFTLLVAVLLSAQTTDARVNLVTPALFARAPDPESMAEMSVEEIHELIRTCGLAPQKAKALAKLAKILVDEHEGEVPQSFEELERLPGVGHKTASVVMAQAFGVPAFPVDTHIHRLAARWGLSTGKSVEKTEEDLKKVFPKERWNDTHIQIILFGREYCPARGHDLTTCPICGWAASKKRIAEEMGGAKAAPKSSAKRSPARRGKSGRPGSERQGSGRSKSAGA
jgi:endonuclease-3